MRVSETVKQSILKSSKAPENIKEIVFISKEGGLSYYKCLLVKPIKNPLGQVRDHVIFCVDRNGDAISVPR